MLAGGLTISREGSLRLTRTSGTMVRQNQLEANGGFSSDRGGIEMLEIWVQIIAVTATGISARKPTCQSLAMNFNFSTFI